MSLPHEIELSSNTIDIHLAGPGYGEGILIVIGNKIIVGVDCCPSLVDRKKRETSYLDKRLAEMADDIHLYWLITHFHLDHFRSFNTVLDLYEDRFESVVVPSAYNEGDHYADMLSQEMKEHTGMTMAGHIVADQLKLLRDSLSRDSLKFKITESAGPSTWINTMLVLPDKKKVPLRIDYYGASHKTLRELRGKTLSKVVKREAGAKDDDAVTDKKKERPYATANEGSYIMHVRAGRFEGLFLGDSESQRTEEILTNRGQSDAEVICLKVAHHGSDDGTTQLLLEKLCDTTAVNTERHALIAPYHGSSLPMPAVVTMLANSRFDVKTSGAKFVDSKVMDDIVKECIPIMSAEVVNAIVAGADVITKSVKL